MPHRKVLIPLDGKKQADDAFYFYLSKIHLPGDEVVIIHCSSFVLHISLPGALVNVEHVSKAVDRAKADAEKVTTAATKILKQKEIKGYAITKFENKPDDAILKAIEEEGISMVVMGTRDLGAVKRTLIGSVSTSVVRHAKVPVTIVKNYHP